MSLRYRPEIDGLRTIAVISVIVYHLKIPLFENYFLPGGFLGVDLFFVLSGYLITGIILAELESTGRFSFTKFYMRRARRILPPLLLVMAAMIPLALWVLLPSELIRFGNSLVAALGFYSNVYWFFELGEYGAQSGLLQPFLHTWSLSIEEQFYLIFPLILLALSRIRSVRWMGFVLIVLLLVSFVLAQATTYFKPSLSFFSPVSRAWELLSGALLALVALKRPDFLRASRAGLFVPAAMLALLLYTIFTTRLVDVEHPGLSTIPVILATCGLIWFSDPREPVTRLLSTRGFVMIGKLSYSLYLWHYPIFAFGRLRSIEEPTWIAMVSWVVLTFACAWAGYALIEKPFRFRVSTRFFFPTLAFFVMGTVGFSFAMDRFAGFPGRYADLAERYGENAFDPDLMAEKSMSILDQLAENETIGRWNAGKRSKHGVEDIWYTDPEKKNVLLIGNSHSKDLFNALYLNRDKILDYEFARLAYSADFNQPEIEEMFDVPNFKEADVIVFAPKYRSSSIEAVKQLVPRLLDLGKEVIIVGNTAEFISPNRLSIFDWYLLRHKGDVDISQVNKLAYRFESAEAKIYSRILAEVSETNGVEFYDRRALLCDDDAQVCTLVRKDGRRTMYDDTHWTLEGAELFGKRSVEAGWFQNDL